MSHTHLLYHLVFATKDRQPMIARTWENQLFSYLAGIVKNQKGFSIEINGIPDHVHMLIRLGPTIALSDFLRELKASSSRWVRENHSPSFGWQRRYGAFTVSESAVPAVRKYIRDQKEHHAVQSFEDEYVSLLKKHNVEFDEKYVWE